MTISADDQGMTYGGTLPALTATYTGLVNGDTPASLAALPTLGTVPATSHAGAYPITAAGAVDADYAISYVSGTLTIGQAALTISTDDQGMTYGGTLPALTATYTGLVNGDTPASLATLPTLSTVPATSHAGAYPITAAGAVDADYAISYVSGTLTIGQAALTISADDQGMTYGGTLPALTATYTGLVNGDTPASLATLPTLGTVPATSHAGAYPITAAGAVDADYAISYVSGTLTIGQAALTISADDQGMTYGGTLAALTATYTGLVNGDTPASLTTLPTLGTVPATSHAGAYPITAAGAVDADYAISYVSGTLTIGQAALTISADDQGMTYGGTLPALTATYTGLVNGDTQASLTTLPTLGTVPATSHAGAYPITADGAVDADYAISYVSGTLTIGQAALTISADDQGMTYGGTLPTLTATYTGLVNGDTPASLTTLPTLDTVPATSHAGAYPITAEGAVDADYAISYVSGTLTIGQAALTISADDQGMTYGGTLPTLTATYMGLVNGDTPASLATLPTLSTVPATSHAGAYPITADGAVDADYAISYVSGTLTIGQAALTISADDQGMTYGGTLPTLTATYTGLVNGDTPASLTTLPTLGTVPATSHAGAYPITAAGAVDADYAISYVSGTLTIGQAALTISADDQGMTYGGTLPALTATYTGLVNGDTPASLPALPTLGTVPAASHAGAYPITADGAVDADYAISYVSGTLTIGQAALTISADDQGMTYGGTLPALTATYTGLVNGDTPASLTTLPTLGTVPAASHAGAYPITADGAVDADYAISYVSGTLTIGQAALTISADDQGMTYGGTLPALTATYTGLVNGDTPASLTALPTLSTVPATSHAGAYPITASGAVDADYAISYVSGTLTIGQAALTISADDQGMTYGGTLPTLTATYTGLVNGDTPASLTTLPTLSTVAATSHAGAYPITAEGAVDADYAISYVSGTLTIGQAALTISADDQDMTYGGTLPTLTATYTGLVNGDTPASLTTLPTLSTVAATSHAGAYPITAEGAVDADYAISYVSGTLTIGQAALTISADDQGMTYGGTLPALTATYTGLVNGDTPASLTTLPTLSTVAATSHAGAYPITAEGAVDADYAISYVSGTLTIGQAALTISADDQGMTYGGTLPALTATYTGLVNGDTPASLTTLPTLSTVPATSHAGAYPITADGAVDADYAISYVSGTLTIGQAALTISADDQGMTYGGTLPALTATYTGLVNGDTPASLAALPTLGTVPATSHAGAYPITADGAVDADYAISYVSGTLTIGQAALTISADDQGMTYGSTLPTLTATYTGLVNGDTPASLAALPTLGTVPAASHAGAYPITAAGAVDADYAISYVSGTLTIGQAALTISADDQGMTYGGTLPALTATYTGLVNGDTPASLTTLPTLGTVPAASHAGAYPITAEGAVDADYAISYVSGTLTIGQAALTITADDQGMTYGGTLPALTATYTGLVNGDTPASLTTLPTLGTVPAASHAGAYPITAEGAVDADYAISYVSGTLTIGQAALTISADDQGMTYGGTLPTLTATYTGLVNGDTPASLAALPTLGTVPAASHAGAYPITAEGAVDADYAISYVSGTLTIGQAALTISADDQGMTYGGTLPALTATYTGLVNGDTPASLAALPTLGTVSATSHAGAYPITAAGAVDADYAISYVSGTLTIGQAALTISADDQGMTYGGTLPALTATYTGLVNGDTPASLTTLPTLGTVPATSHAGAYPITADGAVDADYAISYVSGTLTIGQAALTISADDQGMTYGGTLPTLTATYTGLVNGDTPASLTTLPMLGTVPAASHAGAYPITAAGAVDADYAISYVSGTLTISQAALTISADDQGMTYGGTLPTLTATYTGLVNGDTPANLTALPTLGTVPAASHAGAYPITAAGAVDADYAISYVSGTLTIGQAALTISADDQGMTYGGTLPTLTATYTGLVNGDTPASLTALPTLGTVPAASHAGAYPITAEGAVDADYAISYVSGTLTIGQAALTITADDQGMTYGSTLPALTATYTGLVNGDTPASLATLPTLGTVSATSHAGAYPITAAGAVDADYAISYVSGTLTIGQAALTISADDQGMTYGGTLPALTATYTGLVNGDTPASLTTLPTLGTVPTTSHAGAYPITADGAVDADYAISYVSGTLTIGQAALTITADYQGMTYGGTLPTLTATYTGLVNGDTPASLTTLPTLGTVPAASHAGAYPITAAGAVDADYAISYVSGTLTIGQAALTITADDQGMTYGGTLPTLTATYTGLVNGDTPASLTALPTLGTVPAASHAGAYPITAEGAVDADYAISYVSGTLTIGQAALTITADDQGMTYGGTLPALTATYTGLVNGDTPASLATLPTLGTVSATSHAGAYPITAAGAVDADYAISYVSGTLTIGQAALTISADDQGMTYGGSLPTLTATYTGLVNGDTPASLTTLPTLGTVPATSHAGAYPITAAGAVDADYAISYVSGTLTIGQAALTITADDQGMTYGGTLPTLTATYTGLVNGDTPASLTALPTLGTVPATSHAGAYPITAAGAVDADYAISYVSGTLTIGQAALTISADDQGMTYGGTLPTLTATYTGLVNGDTPASLTTLPTLGTVPATSHAGAYPITAAGAVDADYAISYVSGTLTIGQAALTISADDQGMTYGGTLPALTATYTGLVNGDTPASLTTLPTLGTVPATSHAGAYPITAAGAVDADYAISYVSGTLTIGQADLTISADDQGMTYGGTLPALTATYTGLVNGDTPASLTTLPTLGTVSATSHAGAYPITAEGAVDADYAISYVSGTLTIGQAALTISADDQGMTYGGTLPALTATYTGLVNGDTPASLTALPTLGTVSATSHAGAYPITAAGAVDADYAISYVSGTLTIGQAVINYTIGSDNQTYGSPADLATDLSATVAGVNGETLGIAYSSTGDTATANVGDYAITGAVSDGTGFSSNYIVNLTNGTLTVNKATVNYTIGNDSQTYGSPATLSGDLPATFSTGINGETLDITYSSTGDTATANVGDYAITGVVSDGTGSSSSSTITSAASVVTGLLSNYTVNLTSGTLTVNKATVNYTIGNDSQTYGSPADLATDLSATVAGINGETLDITYSSTGDTATANVGGYGITGVVSDGTGLLSNYTVTLTNGTLTVNKATVNYTIGNDSQTYGTPAVFATDLSATVAGINGETLDIAYSSTGDTATANVGGYGITGVVSDGTGLLSNYTVNLTNGTLTVNKATVNYTIGNDSQTYGTPAVFATDLGTTIAGVNGETLDIAYSSTGDTATANVGGYAITGVVSDGTGLASNYTVNLTSGTLTVSKATVNYTIGNDSQTYGTPAVFATDLGTTIAGVNGETLDIAYSSTGDTATANVGSYAIAGAASNGTGLASNYTVTLTSGTLTVNKATVDYTIGNDSQTYGTPAVFATDLGTTIAGINGENLDIAYSSTGDTATANVGSYAITGVVSDGTGLLSNYTVNLTSGTLTVNKATVDYTIGNDSQTYGTPAIFATDLGTTIAGVNGETLDIAYSSTGDTATANVGSYAIAGAASNGTGLVSNYTVNLTSGTLTVNKATVNYAVGNDSQTYGTPAVFATDLGTTIAGVNGETLDIAYSSTGDTATANVGSYAIAGAASNGTGLVSNYTVTLANGTLTVNPATPAMSVTDLGGTYKSAAFPATGAVTGASGANLGTPEFTYYSGTYTLAQLTGLTGSSGAPVDTVAYTVLASYAATTNYTAAGAVATFTIGQKNVTVPTQNAGKFYGQSDPSPLTTADLSGFYPSDGITASFSRATGENPGAYAITTTLAGASVTLGDYNVTNAGATFTISPSVTGVSSPASGAYGAGTAIPITVTFNEAVTVTGTPQLALNASGGAAASYTSGSGTSTLTFTYTVAAGQTSSDLDYASTGR